MGAVCNKLCNSEKEEPSGIRGSVSVSSNNSKKFNERRKLNSFDALIHSGYQNKVSDKIKSNTKFGRRMGSVVMDLETDESTRSLEPIKHLYQFERTLEGEGSFGYV